MISRYQYHGLTWVDMESPSKEEILHILEEFSLPAILGDEMHNSSLRSKVDLHDNCLYLILHFPSVGKMRTGGTDQEVDFIIGKNFLITVRYEQVEAIRNFAKHFEVDSKIDRDGLARHAGFLFTAIMKQLYHVPLRELEDFASEIREIEERIFKGDEEMMVRRISIANRRLLDFRQAIRFHENVLHSYESASKHFFGEDYAYYAANTMSEYNKVNSLLESSHEILGELQRTNSALLSTKTNDIMRTLTIMTFVMIPLSVITGIFSMNTTSNLVFIQNIRDFYFVVGSMVIVALIMFTFFRIRKWL